MRFNLAMEEELICPVCHNLFVDPVVLPCSHNLCCGCAEKLKSKNGTPTETFTNYFERVGLEVDKASLFSEPVLSDADSGYSAGSLASNSSDQGRSPFSVNGISPTNQQSFNHLQPSSPVTILPKHLTHTYGVNLPSLPESISCLTCPICQATVFLDDRGVKGLNKDTLMQNIIRKYESRNKVILKGQSLQKPSEPNCQLSHMTAQEGKAIHRHASRTDNIAENKLQNGRGNSLDPPKCQMCERNPKLATIKCEQCMVSYCANCREQFHPPRGPLANHILSDVNNNPSYGSLPGKVKQYERAVDNYVEFTSSSTKNSPAKKRSHSQPPIKGEGQKDRGQNGIKLSTCSFHVDENTSMFCDHCQVPLCYQCLEEGRHSSHDVKAIGTTYKFYKGELSQQMGALSNKARQAKDLVMHLRCIQEEIQTNSVDYEARTIAQCNALIEAINHKKQELIQSLALEKEAKCKMVRDQLQQCTTKLKQTTGLLEYCIEVMKDNDPVAFLQVSSGLIQRVALTEQQWTERHLVPKMKSEFALDLDATPLLHAISNFNLVHKKAPEKPIFKISECSANNNTVTISWQAKDWANVDGFLLELDNGSNGMFREVYRGKKTMCTIDGLHFNSIYRTRVSAFNKTGKSHHGEILQLQTALVASFYMDPLKAHPDMKFTNDYHTVNCSSNENRVVLGSIGFSKGVHYWEYSIDRYESTNPDVVCGVAYVSVDTSSILGKDNNAWAMYIDNSRSWLLHGDEHTNRCDGGVDVGSRLGVLLDVDHQQVTFYVNQKQRGNSISLINSDDDMTKHRVYYPGLSLNRHVQVTLWSGLKPPRLSRPSLCHSHSFAGSRTLSSSYKKKMVGNHELLHSKTNSNSAPRPTKQPPSPTATMQQQKRSQSSGDLCSQQSSPKLYESLPSQPILVNGGSAVPNKFSGIHKLPVNTANYSKDQTSSENHNVVTASVTEKPALKQKPPQLVQLVRGRQQRKSNKVPPQPPLRRGSSNSSLSTVGSGSASTNSDTMSVRSQLSTFQ